MNNLRLPVFPTLTAVLVLVGTLHVRTCLAEANIVFPPNSGVVDVTQEPYNADNTGATDATAAIQAALDVNQKVVIIYFPSGTYKVSNTLACATYGTAADNHGPLIVGQSRTGTVIRLADGTFTDESNPKPIMITGDGVAQNFYKTVHNLTFNVGRNNPGANGIYFYANNMGLISEVDIISEDGQGVKGLDLGYGEQGPCGAKSIYIKGFQHGIYSDALNGVACTQISLEGQTVAGIYNANRYLWFDSLTSVNTVPVAINRGDLVVINAQCRGGSSSGAAVRHEGNMFYGRDIVAEGYSRAVSGTNAPSGMTVDEYRSHAVRRLWDESPEVPMDLPIQRPPEIPWDSDPTHWGLAESYKGGLGVPQRSDREALQAAIDDPKNTIVFIPCCRWWNIDDTVYLRGNVRRFVGGLAQFNTDGGGALVIDDQGSAPAVAVNWMLGLPIINRSSKQVVLTSIGGRVYGEGTGDMYVVDLVGGAKITNPAQKMWSWQFNAEGHPITPEEWETSFNLHVDAGRVWIFGWKDEGTGWAGKLYGGLTEVIGFLQYDNTADGPSGPKVDPPEWIISDAAFSLANRSYIAWASSPAEYYYPTLVSETRGGETRELTSSSGGHQYGLFTAYRPEDLDAVQAVSEDGRAVVSKDVNGSVTSHEGILRIDLRNHAANTVRVRVLDLQGRIVENREATSEALGGAITLENLRSGAYVVQIAGSGQSQAESVVVAR